jgi:hypothetical protein
MTTDDALIAAHHEAGHATIACLLGHTVTSVTLGLVKTTYDRDDPHGHLAEAKIACAGPCAEARYLHQPFARQQVLWFFGDSADRINACRHLSAAGFESCIHNLEILMRRTRPMVRSNWSTIMRVAAELEARRTLTGDEVSRLCLGIKLHRSPLRRAGALASLPRGGPWPCPERPLGAYC